MQYIHRIVAESFVPNQKNLPVIDHVDGNKLNNHYKNLRWCTVSKNNLNSDKREGYYYSKKNNRYYPRVKHKGKAKSLGGYSSTQEASHVYQNHKKDLIERID